MAIIAKLFPKIPSDINKLQPTSNQLNIKDRINKFFDYVWPIERSELPKFLYITLMMFCILFIQNVIRALKDSIVNTMIGTESIAFLKFWGVLPAAILITIVYVKLVNVMSGNRIFYLIMSTFLAFFGVFAFLIFPNHEMLHLSSETALNLTIAYPHLKWFILLLSNWSFSLFYIIAELWPNAVFALLFWQFVNKITTVEESKRFYPLFGLLGQTGLYISGQFLQSLPYLSNSLITRFHLLASDNLISVQIVLSIVLILGATAIFAFWMINHKVLDFTQTEEFRFKVKKHNTSLVASFKMICSSRYIRLIALMLLCYGIAVNLVEGPWKNIAREMYPTSIEYMGFAGQYLSYTGIFTLIFVLICSNTVRRVGWFSSAIITPIILFVLGLLFFLVFNFDSISVFLLATSVFTNPILLAVNIGIIHNVLTKSSKYVFFDATKEMAYVPLEDDLKTQGKAAADMLGTKLGKSSSALFQSLIFIILPNATFQSVSMHFMIVFTVVCLIWIWAVFQLNKEYKQAILHNTAS